MAERDVRHHARPFIVHHLSFIIINSCVNLVTLSTNCVRVVGIKGLTFAF